MQAGEAIWLNMIFLQVILKDFAKLWINLYKQDKLMASYNALQF